MSWPPAELRTSTGSWTLEDDDLARLQEHAPELPTLVDLMRKQQANAVELAGLEVPVLVSGSVRLQLGHQPLPARAVLKTVLQVIPRHNRYEMMNRGLVDVLVSPCRVRARVAPGGGIQARLDLVQAPAPPLSLGFGLAAPRNPLRPAELLAPDGSWAIDDAHLARLPGPGFTLPQMLAVARRRAATRLELVSGQEPCAVFDGPPMSLGHPVLTPVATFKLLLEALSMERRTAVLEDGRLNCQLEHPGGPWRLFVTLDRAGLQCLLEPA